MLVLFGFLPPYFCLYSSFQTVCRLLCGWCLVWWLRPIEFWLMVIGSCFIQFTRNSRVMSFFCVISIGSFVVSPLYSISTPTFPKNLVEFLFTTWYLSFSGWTSFWLYSSWLLGMNVTGDLVSIVKF